jgi:hydroxylysine kinase
VSEVFASPFAPLGDNDVESLLATFWGLTAVSWSPFGSEKDDTLHVTSAEGEFVLKVAHPEDNPGRIHRQLSLMTYIGEKSLLFATQIPLPTLSGDFTATVNNRLAHLLPFLPGTPIRHSPQGDDGVRGIGAAVWQLQKQLAHYQEPYDTEHPWALGSVETIYQFIDAVSNEPIRGGCALILGHVIEHTVPRLAELPVQPTHNDVHTDNVLMDGSIVAGIVDWGDSVIQPRIADLAVAASYARGYHPMWLDGDPWQAARTLRDGYIDAGGPDEHEDLFGDCSPHPKNCCQRRRCTKRIRWRRVREAQYGEQCARRQ